MVDQIPTLEEIQNNLNKIRPFIRETPVWNWESDLKNKLVGKETNIHLKLELFQYGGSFKPRGAITNMLALDESKLLKGVTAVSAGNHAIAVAYSSLVLGTKAKVAMPKTANIARVEKCKSLGAEVILKDNVHLAFDEVMRIQKDEGKSFIHPFEGFNTALGTATLGFEFGNQIGELDAVIIPIGGGGLCAGVAAAIKQLNPSTKVIGVEPLGADSMTRSFKSGKPESIEEVKTIADSLGAPYALPYTFSLCQQFVDEIVLISDQEICNALALMFYDLKLAVEPAGASALAALIGPLKEQLTGQKVGLIICGSNIDSKSYGEYLINGDSFYQQLIS